MEGQGLLTELKNLAVLPGYGSSKLAPYDRIRIGILPKIRLNELFFLTPPVLDLETQFSGYE